MKKNLSLKEFESRSKQSSKDKCESWLDDFNGGSIKTTKVKGGYKLHV